ncbi:hypothetical protein QL285_096091 [Trifolium repens]|nr:hypothetical protein QL285_096091 [Trifolium repens]
MFQSVTDLLRDRWKSCVRCSTRVLNNVRHLHIVWLHLITTIFLYRIFSISSIEVYGAPVAICKEGEGFTNVFSRVKKVVPRIEPTPG